MNLINRWKAPTPKKWKRIMYTSMTLAAAAAVFLNAEKVGGIIVPGFKFTLVHWAEVMWKYVLLGGAASAAVAKFQKENPPEADDEEKK